MNRFFVGQRVRIKWSEAWPELTGQEGKIVGPSKKRPNDDPRSEWRVAPDVWGTEIAPPTATKSGKAFAPMSSQLEPITDCYDKAEWSDCVWRPDHMREVTI